MLVFGGVLIIFDWFFQVENGRVKIIQRFDFGCHIEVELDHRSGGNCPKKRWKRVQKQRRNAEKQAMLEYRQKKKQSPATISLIYYVGSCQCNCRRQWILKV